MARNDYHWTEPKALEKPEVKDLLQARLADDRAFDLGELAVNFGGNMPSLELCQSEAYQKILDNEAVYFYYQGLSAAAKDGFFQRPVVQKQINEINKLSQQLVALREQTACFCPECLSEFSGRYCAWDQADLGPVKGMSEFAPDMLPLPSLGQLAGACPLCQAAQLTSTKAAVDKNQRTAKALALLHENLDEQKRQYAAEKAVHHTFIAVISKLV